MKRLIMYLTVLTVYGALSSCARYAYDLLADQEYDPISSEQVKFYTVMPNVEVVYEFTWNGTSNNPIELRDMLRQKAAAKGCNGVYIIPGAVMGMRTQYSKIAGQPMSERRANFFIMK